MTVETQNEQRNAVTMGAIVDLMIETQTILQLLVKHDLVTREEVEETRRRVRNQPKYRDMYDKIIKDMADIEENIKFENLVEKSLQKDGNKNLTKSEREYLLNRINQMVK